MNKDFTTLRANGTNPAVIDYLADSSAHSDIAEALCVSVAPLGDVQTFSPDILQYRYVVVSTQTTIFGFARGMNMIAFRLDQKFRGRALQTGALEIPDLAPNWISFMPFRDDWPSVDLRFWARKAYVYARESVIV